MLEVLNRLNGCDGPILVTRINEQVDGLVPAHAGRVAQIVKLHDVARREQVARKAPDVTGLERQPLAYLTTIRESDAVVGRVRQRVVERFLYALVFVSRNRQRESQTGRNRPGRARERQSPHSRIQAGKEWAQRAAANVIGVRIDVSGRGKASQVIQVEGHSQLAADAVVSEAKTAAKNRLAPTPYESPKQVVAKIRRPCEGNRGREVIPVLPIVTGAGISLACEVESYQIIEGDALCGAGDTSQKIVAEARRRPDLQTLSLIDGR